ncbi:polymorphic toxin-type HINT domain-containing protein [Chryseobacterium gallinarum]|uniref:polymorphic toxin-type HINT domain-containing protein n=1 Tax=Chryseobacterium gallinarum TaxID=1324352 RepID=UPI002024D233|nr:polymorphic toxin-type HINT domain-containing protein [Chryseobacterium gallinarum]MCL8538068.1 polymorphic toxin-type HINT domain-containing protein [Chryseobacterium gallinarum]
MDELEYITLNALMMCDQGAAPDFFKPTFNTKVKIHGCLVATNQDARPLINIPSFKVCKISGGPCTPGTVPMTWKDTWQVKINGINSLIGKSTCQCSVGGKIEFMTSGQVPLPDDAAKEVKDMQDQAQRELDDSGQGNSVGEAGLVEGMIPVWGSGRDLINDIQTGDVGGSLMNAGFLIWDVASIAVGVFSFGAGTVAMQGAKAGVKGAIKAGAKAISKEALQQMGKAAMKKLSKEALKKSVDDVAKKLLKTCVFACFPAGTPVHTEDGIKNIEDIRVGDLVWAYDEDTDTVALQPVIDLITNESDHTISIYTEAEVIETTAIHPFYTEEGWKDASELEAGEKILTKNDEKVTIERTEYSYEPKKVYNFTVDNFHTYFVGMFAWLVHNAGRCLSNVVKKVSKRLQYLGRTPGKASKTGREVFDRMMKEVPPTARIRRGQKEFFDKSTNQWRNIKEADMGHIEDAVSWWNKTGRKYGKKSKEVREWMLDSKNYVLEYYRTNRSKGAQLLEEYLPPLK